MTWGWVAWQERPLWAGVLNVMGLRARALSQAVPLALPIEPCTLTVGEGEPRAPTQVEAD